MRGSAITPFAWFFMLLSMGAVSALAAYCYYRILSGPRRLPGEPPTPPGGGPVGGRPPG